MTSIAFTSSYFWSRLSVLQTVTSVLQLLMCNFISLHSERNLKKVTCGPLWTEWIVGVDICQDLQTPHKCSHNVYKQSSTYLDSAGGHMRNKLTQAAKYSNYVLLNFDTKKSEDKPCCLLIVLCFMQVIKRLNNWDITSVNALMLSPWTISHLISHSWYSDGVSVLSECKSTVSRGFCVNLTHNQYFLCCSDLKKNKHTKNQEA